MDTLNGLEMVEQLELVEHISNLTSDQLLHPHEPLGRFNRRGTTFYRLRAKDHRFYFEIEGDTLYCHYILHKNTLTDFIFRTKLPITEEQILEQHNSFWKYLESLRKEN